MPNSLRRTWSLIIFPLVMKSEKSLRDKLHHHLTLHLRAKSKPSSKLENSLAMKLLSTSLRKSLRSLRAKTALSSTASQELNPNLISMMLRDFQLIWLLTWHSTSQCSLRSWWEEEFAMVVVLLTTTVKLIAMDTKWNPCFLRKLECAISATQLILSSEPTTRRKSSLQEWLNMLKRLCPSLIFSTREEKCSTLKLRRESTTIQDCWKKSLLS